MPHEVENTRSEMMSEFVELLGRHQIALFQYVAPLVPSIQDAEDVMQEILKAIWENFEQYEKGTNFLAWARKIAHFRVLEFHRASRRRPLFLPDDVLDALGQHAELFAQRLDERSEALEHCYRKLSENDRRLVHQRYSGASIAALAEAVGRSANAIYQTLWRIRRNLLACVERRLREQAEARGSS